MQEVERYLLAHAVGKIDSTRHISQLGGCDGEYAAGLTRVEW